MSAVAAAPQASAKPVDERKTYLTALKEALFEEMELEVPQEPLQKRAIVPPPNAPN